MIRRASKRSFEFHITLALAVFVVILALAVEAARLGLLGPYGQPGDNLHILILTASLWAAFLSFYVFILLRGRV